MTQEFGGRVWGRDDVLQVLREKFGVVETHDVFHQAYARHHAPVPICEIGKARIADDCRRFEAGDEFPYYVMRALVP